MKLRPAVRVGAVLLVAAIAANRAEAFLGFGDIVFDPSNYEEAVQQLIQMERQYAQLVQSYLMLGSQYDHMVRMAKRVPVDMTTRYRAVVTKWQGSSATNTYGTTGGWITAINTGSSVPTAYATATEPLGAYGTAAANVPAEQLERLKTSYGTIELTDGANQSAIKTIGRLRGNSSTAESAIQRLEDDSLSADPLMNTEIAVLNKINAAGVLAVRANQDTNKLLVALAEQQILQAKRIRDAEARAINQHIRFRAEGRAVLAAQAAGASQAMLAWRMP